MKNKTLARAVAVLTLVGLDRLALRADRVDRLFRGPGLAVGALALVSLPVDVWARAG